MHHRHPTAVAIIDLPDERLHFLSTTAGEGVEERSVEGKILMTQEEKLFLPSSERMRKRVLLVFVLFGVIPFLLRSMFFTIVLPYDFLPEIAAQFGSGDHLGPRIPNVLVIGAPESGTGSTASWLFGHRSVCRPFSSQDTSPIKEVHFFDKDERLLQDLGFYASHYSHCDYDSVMIDATPEYFQHAYRVKEAYNKLGDQYLHDLKIIMILRNPIDRELAMYKKMAEDYDTATAPYSNVQSVMGTDGKLKSFDDYTITTSLPEIKSSPAFYAKFIRRWFQHFDRRQILILSYDEVEEKPESAMSRIKSFLNLKSDRQLRVRSGFKELDDVSQNLFPSCEAQALLASAFERANDDLYKLLEEEPGPDQEQRPFPEFGFRECLPSTATTPVELNITKIMRKRKKEKKPDKAAAVEKPVVEDIEEEPGDRTTIFFAAHHKTGTTLSQLVATRLRSLGHVFFDEKGMDEGVLTKRSSGDNVECIGTKEKPEIRSYLHWPQWMIGELWNPCVEMWWENWPSMMSHTDELLSNCREEGIGVSQLTRQLRNASCGDDYQVVHFVRSPIDIILSSYRYTRQGGEGWMHEKLGNHPRFTPSLCGEEACTSMTMTEAVNKLPTCTGIVLEMRLVSLEIVKQMLVAASLAKADPDRHVTVNLSELMKSSKSYEEVWTRTAKEIFPDKAKDELWTIVKSLKDFDLNQERTEGNETETMQQMQCLFEDAGVRMMLNDPLVKKILKF